MLPRVITKLTLPLIGVLTLCSITHGKDQFAKHVEQSLVLYKGGKYAESLAALQAAYSLRKQPRLLCNMARTYRKLGDDKSALQNYRACLQQDRSLPVAQRADIEHYIDELEALLNPDTQKQKEIIGKAITAGDHTTPVPPPTLPSDSVTLKHRWQWRVRGGATDARTDKYLLGVWGSSPQALWAVGSSGTILRYRGS